MVISAMRFEVAPKRAYSVKRGASMDSEDYYIYSSIKLLTEINLGSRLWFHMLDAESAMSTPNICIHDHFNVEMLQASKALFSRLPLFPWHSPIQIFWGYALASRHCLRLYAVLSMHQNTAP